MRPRLAELYIRRRANRGHGIRPTSQRFVMTALRIRRPTPYIILNRKSRKHVHTGRDHRIDRFLFMMRNPSSSLVIHLSIRFVTASPTRTSTPKSFYSLVCGAYGVSFLTPSI